MGFSDSSVGKESTCNARDPSLIPMLGRSPEEGKGYPLQYCGLENSVDCPWGHKESDMTEGLSLSLMVLWLRVCLPIQGTWVRSLVGELRSHMLKSN